MNLKQCKCSIQVIATLLASLPLKIEGSTVFQPSDVAASDLFGFNLKLSNNTALVASSLHDIPLTNSGAAYVFRTISAASGLTHQDAKLQASDAGANDRFGRLLSMDGTIGLVGAFRHTIGSNSFQGAAYVFRNLDTVTGTVNQNAKLVASDGATNHEFGHGVDISGTIGIVGAIKGNGVVSNQGAAYVFRNLDTVTGLVNESAKLLATDGAPNDEFGCLVAISGTTGVVGARSHDLSFTNQGAAYIYRNLDLITGNATQNAKLFSSDGATNDFFGHSVSISGNAVIVGAYAKSNGSNIQQGAAYYFQDVGSFTGNHTETAKLMASDGLSNDWFGFYTTISGNNGMVSALQDSVGASNQGSLYIFTNLSSKTGTIFEDVKIWLSSGEANDRLGHGLSLDGDQFFASATGRNSDRGIGVSNYISTFTTLDSGSVSRATLGFSFNSLENWVIGQNSSNNTMILRGGDSGNVTATGKAVIVGQNATASLNTLAIHGNLTANTIIVGHAGNTGNVFTYNATAVIINNGTGPVGGNITLNAGGLLLAGASHKIEDDFRMVLNGGTVDTGGHSEVMGRLSLASTSAISFNGTMGVWQFADSSMESWIGFLYVHNWNGTLVTGGGAEQLMFGTSNTTLTSGQLNQIIFVNPSGLPAGSYNATWATSNFGEVVPIPEPASFALAGLGFGVLALWRVRRRGL